MLRLLLGKDWITVKNEILSRISDDVAARRVGRILMVPELISHDTERRLCAAAGDTASRFAEVLSFTRLARRVSDATGCKLPECLDNGGRVVAMAAAARQLHSRLKAYASVETKPEFLTGLVDAVDEFKRCCITAEDLAEAAKQATGSLAQKLEEVSLLLSAYDALCSQGKRDPREQMTWLLEQLEDGNFGEEHSFYIDGFPDFTRQHLAILEHLIRVSPQVTVGLNCDRVDSRNAAFEKAADTAAALIKCAKAAGVAVVIEDIPGRDSNLVNVCGALFQGQLPQQVTDLQTLRADSAFDEVQVAAEQILALVRSGCRYRDISVVCADMASYQNFVDLVFHRCGIPMYRSGTEDVLRNTVVVTVLAALDAALGGFEQRDVLRYLRSVLSPLDADTCDLVENYAVTWNVRGSRWQNAWTNHPDGLRGIPSEESDALLTALNAARELAITPLTRLHKGFKETANLSGQVDALRSFLDEIGLQTRLEQLAQLWDAEGDNRSAQILNQIWDILLSALEQMQGVLGQTAWENEVFTRLLTLLLSQYNVGTIPPVLDAVTVGPVSAMRCQQAKHLIVLGACEGALPGYGGASGILTDQERVQLRSMGVALTGGAMEGIQAEFAEIYGVFCGATQTVTVSYPGGQPSYVYRRLAQMCGGEVYKKPELVAALTDAYEAGAYLAQWDAAAAAQKLGVLQQYSDASDKIQHDLGRIDTENVKKLYGSRLHLSASQIDRQAECRLSYFLQYGLRAKERKEATVDPAEFGTYVHWVLEHTARDVMKRGGFHLVSLEDTLQIAMSYSDRYAQENFKQVDSQRIAYLFRRNRRELEMVVEELWEELKQADFAPAEFELQFGDGGKMDAIALNANAMQAVLRGFVDRVDICKKDGRNYFRVVDYKTGRKDFDYCDVFNGVGLQLLLYLFALEQNGAQILGDDPIAAGVQYFPARAPLVASDSKLTDEEAKAARQKEWKRRGLLLNDDDVLAAMDNEDMSRLSCKRNKDGKLTGDIADRQQMKLLRQYIFALLGAMVDEIASGNVTPNPYTRGTSHDACTFCPFGAVCHPAAVEGRRNYKTMTAQRFWEEIEQEVDDRG
ncbi:MAG: exodeoxyribonuclease V subunit gamma [Oscillospiraceae bacterium]|nr:exodeoxyribonuclease V subunit gamma [Oscillospiraceae bacterium]